MKALTDQSVSDNHAINGFAPSEHAPTISVVINNYNYAQFLAEAIESALNQTYPFNEVIVVDDGSSDSSPKIIDSYGQRVKPIYQPNGGQAAALNAGMRCVHSDYVIFLDADDCLELFAAEKIIRSFSSHPGAVKAQYRMEVINTAGKKVGIKKPASQLTVPDGDLSQQALAFPFDIPWLPTSGNAFAVQALRQILPIPEEDYTPVGADWYLCQVSNLLGAVIFIDEGLACYRVHERNHYETDQATLNLAHIRQSIQFADRTTRHLQRIARQFNYRSPTGGILAVSFIANRLISLRLDPQHHPIPGDTRWKLLILGQKAASRRFDVPPARRVVFGLWFLLTTLAPRLFAERLANWFLFPEKRPGYRRHHKETYEIQG